MRQPFFDNFVIIYAMKRKKILFVITKSNWGGAQKYTFDLATNMPEYDVIVALGGDGELKRRLEEYKIRTLTIESLGRDISMLKDISVLFNLISLFKKEKPDIVHLNSSKIGGLGSLAGRITCVKNIIFTAHGWAFKEDRNIISKIVIKFLSWLTILLSHNIIVLSQFEKACSPTKLMRKKIHVIYNGIKDIEMSDRRDARNELQKYEPLLPNDSLWIGSVAELHNNKGLTYLIDAFAEVNPDNASLLLIGEGEERKNLENQIGNLKMQNKIFMLGSVSDANKYLKALDIFALTSKKEGFPYTILEAGFVELPVMASKVGGIPEIIKNNETGLLSDSQNMAQIKANLKTLIEQKEKRTTYGAMLKKHINKHFTFENMLRQTKKLYN